MLLLLSLGCSYLDSVGDRLYDTGTPVACDPRVVLYQDADGDGFGDASHVYIGCETPTGFVENATDCNDADATLTESCDTGA